MYAPCDGLVDVWVGGDGVEGGGEFFLVVKDRRLRKRRRGERGERRREKERETKSEREKEKGK